METQKHSAEIPPVIAAYWRAANAGDSAAAAACSAADAVVHDEGHAHRGRPAIQQWVHETTRHYRPQVEPLHALAVGAEGRLEVTARVTGNFPASPVELEFAFTLRADHITNLEIL